MEERIQVTGRRKTSIARIFLKQGSGQLLVNGRSPKDYFKRETLVIAALEPFRATETRDRFDVEAMVCGGGLTGQAGALRLGLARGLLKALPDLRAALRKGGFLSRDAREKERKKYGQAGARKRFQFSKR
jgi:small subunit ribosomal protein S9